jgi:hypothetical protein
MNWNDPSARLDLVERVGTKEYNRLLEDHVRSTTKEVVNGWGIRPVQTRFGRLWQVSGTANAYMDLETARAKAAGMTKGPL